MLIMRAGLFGLGLTAWLAAAAPADATAALPAGRKTIVLVTAGGARQVIGSVIFWQ
jgi:hypothetical protein